MIGERSARRGVPIIAAIGAAGVVLAGIIVDLREVAVTFLVAYAAAVSVALGTLAMTLIAHLTTATWFRSFRSSADLILRSLPVLAALGGLLLLAVPTLYPWAAADSPLHAYLNVPFFVVRAIAYWAAWLAISAALRRARRPSGEDASQVSERVRRVASVGLVVLAVTMTLASFDWMMSLTPDWQSSIYGVYWFAGGVLGALALLAILADSDREAQPGDYADAPSTDDVDSLGKLLLTFVLFWVYTGFAQYIVIWSAGIPREVAWYVPRTRGAWGGVAVVLLFGGFLFPFLLLLVRGVRRRRGLLAGLGMVLLALRCVDMAWVIMPGLIAVTWWTVVVGIAVCMLIFFATTWVAISRNRRASAQTLPPIHLSQPLG